jgi:transposase-like protein
MYESGEVGVPTQDAIRTDLRALFRGAIRLTLESLLEEEIRELVGAGRWQRLGERKDVRNGTYLRRLMTSMGLVELQIPRARETGSAGEVLGRYQRRTGDVDAAITEAYVQGVSQRKMAKVTEALLGEAVSRSTVSRVTKRLDERIAALRTAPIAEPIAYLYLDATMLEARWARTVEHVAALVAYGVGPDGHRRLLGVALGPSESEASWSELLTQLVDRGLHGVQLVIADAHKGLAAAVRQWLPEARQQRCTVHLLRNVLTQTPQRLRARLVREVSPLFDAPSLAEAKRRLDAVLRRWRPQLPEAMAVLEGGFTAATQFYVFPTAHWLRIRSTNTLERLHGEVQRRVKAVGAFPDRASALRLVTAVALEVTTIWADRRYLDMTLLEPAAAAAA